MSSHIVYSNVHRRDDVADADADADVEDHGYDQSRTLFAGQKLWFSHSVPQRKWLIENARNNGAVIVTIDTNADIKLVDHTRKNQPVGAYSYKYVELSIRRGQLENLAPHAVGVATRVARPVGSTTTAPRGSRVPYTEEDDQFLYNWMKPFEDSGGAYKGNEIYKQIEQVNPRHTYQSWRDRWLKATRFQKRQVTRPAESEQQDPHHDPEEETQRAPTLPDISVHRPEQDHSKRTALPPRKRKLVSVHNEPSEVRPPHLSEASRRQAGPELHTTDTSTGATQPLLNEDEHAVQKDLWDGERSQKGMRNVSTQDYVEDEEIHTENEKKFLNNIRGPFSKADSLPLYRLVPRLSHMGLQEFDNVWRQMASSEDYKHHSAKQWKHWFEYRVLPDYCRIEQVPIDQIAPYMSMRKENSSSGGGIDDDDDDDQPADSDVDMNQDKNSRDDPNRCTNCYTMEAQEWHHDKKGRLLCNPCAVFLRAHGVPRPSTIGLVNLNTLEEDRSPDPRGLQTPSHSSSLQKLAITPIVSSIKVSPKILPVDVTSAARGRLTTPRAQRDIRSPSFQPESPTLIRAPEPNEARKRSTGPGRDSQSQSTQSTNGTSNQGNTQSFSQIHGLSIDGTQPDDGQTPSKEHTGRKNERPANTAPSFSFVTSSSRGRPRLHDGPDNLDVQQDSSLSTDRGPPREPPVVYSSTETEVVLNSPLLAPRSVSRDSPLPIPEGFSPLFVAQDDEEEDLEAMEGLSTLREEEAVSEDDGMTSPLRLDLVSDEDQSSPIKSEHRHETPEDSDNEEKGSSSHSTPSHETSQRNALDSYHTSRETMDEYETAPEQPPRKRRHPGDRLSTQALFGQADIDEEVSAYLEVVEPEGGWDSILGPDSVEDDGGGGGAAAANSQQEQQQHQQSTDRPEALDHSAAAYRRDLEKDLRPGEFLIDAWCRRQKERLPNVHDAFLLQAAHCTTQEYGPKTEQMVEYFLDQWRRKRQRTSSASDRSSKKRPSKSDLTPPSDVQGVWTDEDDELLKSTDATHRRRVLNKHGKEACMTRRQYLRDFGS
ncbi:hypothetical protein RBB50_007362 [Rhinocladiella similis]